MATEFHLFPFLPAELRLQIWRATCHSRVVEVRYSSSEDRCLTTTPPPVILQVCQESRHEALSRIYLKAFGTKTHPDGTIFFSPEMDILYIPRCDQGMGYDDTARDFGSFVLNTVEHVHSLAIDHVNPMVRRPWETYNKFCLMRTFPSLQEVFLILASTSSSRSSSPRTQQSSPDAADNGSQGQGQIEFVDPRGDPREIMRLMENVRESFTHEVGQTGQVEGLPSLLERDHDHHDCDDKGDEQAIWEQQPYMALVPKTKVRYGVGRRGRRYSHSQRWNARPAFVSCV